MRFKTTLFLMMALAGIEPVRRIRPCAGRHCLARRQADRRRQAADGAVADSPEFPRRQARRRATRPLRRLDEFDRVRRQAGQGSRSRAHRAFAGGMGNWRGQLCQGSANATVSVLSNDGASVADVVVTLRSPKLDGDTLTFVVDVLEGSLDGANGPASTFIDIIGMPLTPMSFAGAARRTAYRGAWYAGAAAGAAAAAAPTTTPVRPAATIRIRPAIDHRTSMKELPTKGP